MSNGRKPRQVLKVIAVLMLVSGAVRVAMGMEPAIAYAQEQSAPEVMAEATQTESVDITPLLAALQAREARVLERENALENRLLALANAEETLTSRLMDLEAAERSLMDAIALSETANDSDIARLTSIYENMKPADAAGLFEQMAPEFASGFLVRMNPQAAASIMAGLEPQTAYSVSAIIAGRNANAPTE